MRASRLTPWLFLSPWLLGLVALVLYPFAASLYWSFCRYDLLTPPHYIGTAHYQRLATELVHGGLFRQALWNTFYYAIFGVPLSIAVGVLLAVLLQGQIAGRSAYRAALFLPSVVPVVAAAIAWRWLLDPQDGFINTVLASIGLPTPGWFNSTREFFTPIAWVKGEGGLGSKDALLLMHLWGIGNFLVIYLAALDDVPGELYEAARLDGAGPWRRFRHVTLPMLSPVILFNAVMGLLQAVQVFAQVYVVSEGVGAPAGSTLVLSLHLFLAAFKYLDMGYASAVAWVLLLLMAVATWLLFRSTAHLVHYRGGAR